MTEYNKKECRGYPRISANMREYPRIFAQCRLMTAVKYDILQTAIDEKPDGDRAYSFEASYDDGARAEPHALLFIGNPDTEVMAVWPFRKKVKNAEQQRQKKRELNFRAINRPRADRTIEGNEAIYAAVSRISNTLASMPVHLYKGYEVAKNHPLERLVSLEPNANMTSFVFKQTMEVLRNTEGNAYALKILDNLGQVRRLDILNPTRVQIMRNPADGEIWYRIQMDDVPPMVIPGYMVLNMRHMSANGEKGIRPIDVLRKSLDYDTQVKELSLDQLDGVNSGIMLTVPDTGLDQEQKDELVDRFLDTYEKSGRSVVVLEGGLTANHFQSDAVDSDQLDVERITRNRVATVYNLPPHFLGDYTGTSYSSAEQQMLEFLMMTMAPIVQQWEEEMDRKLLTPAEIEQGYEFRFDMNAVYRADMATTANRNQIAIRGGWMTPNEARKNEGLPPDDNGDQLMSSRDIIPLEIAVRHPEMLLGNSGGRPAESGAGTSGGGGS